MEISTLTRRGLIAAAVAGALALAGCGDKGAAPAANTAAKADLTPIGIVQLVEHSALDAATRGIVDALAERGYKDGVNIKLDIQNAQGDQSNLHNIADAGRSGSRHGREGCADRRHGHHGLCGREARQV